MLTEAEILFEQFCNHCGIPFARIPTGRAKSPDYEVRLGGALVAIEVKQLEPNAEDRAFFQELITRGVAARSVSMGRARSAMHEGTKQLRSYAKGRIPGLVLLHDTMGSSLGFLDSYSIARCLYGPERVHFAVPVDASVDAGYLGMSRGGGSVATKDHNTTLSGVAVLRRRSSEAPPDLEVYHNLYAAMPIPPELCEAHGIRQFHFAESERGAVPEWKEYLG